MSVCRGALARAFDFLLLALFSCIVLFLCVSLTNFHVFFVLYAEEMLNISAILLLLKNYCVLFRV